MENFNDSLLQILGGALEAIVDGDLEKIAEATRSLQ